MTVRARLVLTVLGIAVLLLIPSLYAIVQLEELSEIASELRGRHAAAFLSLGRLQTTIAELDRYERSYVATPDPELRQGVSRAFAETRAQLASLRRAGYAESAAVVALRVDSLEQGALAIETLVRTGRVQEASAELERIKPLFGRIQQSLDRIGAAIDRRSVALVDRAQALTAAAISTALIALAAALTLALLLGAWTTRALTQPLRRLRSGMANVADGDFQTPEPLPYRRGDEIGDLARSFRWMTGKLAELERVRAEFISMASHDLKTPINIIGGYSELLEDGLYGELQPKQREALEAIHEQTHVLTRLVQQLVDVSRIEAGGFHVELSEAVVRDIFTSVERSFAALAKQKGVAFRVDADETLPRSTLADADRLRNEVLGNLLSNAFKFTPEGGQIRVAARREGDEILIDVSDTGIGIPRDQIERVFEKYFQVGGEARQMGSGLGLAIAREVVESHDGTITVESEVGRGTTFHIRLPIRSAPPNSRRT